MMGSRLGLGGSFLALLVAWTIMSSIRRKINGRGTFMNEKSSMFLVRLFLWVLKSMGRRSIFCSETLRLNMVTVKFIKDIMIRTRYLICDLANLKKWCENYEPFLIQEYFNSIYWIEGSTLVPVETKGEVNDLRVSLRKILACSHGRLNCMR